jgi:hypothetical protein
MDAHFDNGIRGAPTALLIEPAPEGSDADSISQNTETHEEKSGFHPWDDQSAGTDHPWSIRN